MATSTVAEVIPNRLRLSLGPCLLLVSNLFVFGVLSIYITNTGEFPISILQLVLSLLVPGVCILIILLALDALLPSSIRNYYLGTVMALGVLTYLHGNILLWDYGILDGADLSISNDWRLWADISLWVLVLTITWMRLQNLLKHLPLISGVLISIQAAAIVWTFFSHVQQSQPIEQKTFPTDFARFSKSANVIHLVLDAFQADIFEELVAENEAYRKIFSGFTFFRDATTSSAVTYLSIPASSSSKIFINDRSISEYRDEGLAGDNLFEVFFRSGYEIDVATPSWWHKPNKLFTNYFRIPAPYKGSRLMSTSTLLFDLSLFRQVPHFLKANVYNSQSWLFSRWLSDDPWLRFEHYSHLAFLQDITNEMAVSERHPVYKFIHLITPHAPMVSNELCQFPGEALAYTRSNYLQQAYCTTQVIAAFLETLKQKGIYDSSLILIHGDHGAGIPFRMRDSNGHDISSEDAKFKLWGSLLPLVLIKPPNEKSELRISNAQVQLSDIPVTVSSLSNIESSFQGRNMFNFTEDEDRARYYYWSDTHRNDAGIKDFFDQLHTYEIHGPVYEESSWHRGQVLRSKILDSKTTYIWNASISFGSAGTSKISQVSSWGATDAYNYTWTDGEKAVLTLDVEQPTKDVELLVNVKPFIVPGKLEFQRVVIFLSKREVGIWRITRQDFHTETLRIAKEYFGKGGQIEISFEFPDAAVPARLGVNADKRKLALAFQSMLLREI